MVKLGPKLLQEHAAAVANLSTVVAEAQHAEETKSLLAADVCQLQMEIEAKQVVQTLSATQLKATCMKTVAASKFKWECRLMWRS